MSFEEIKKNKTAQLAAGLLTAAIAFKLYQMGVWERWLNPPEPEGYESSSLLAMGLAAVVSALQLVGLLAMTFVGQIVLFAKDAIKPLADKAKGALEEAETDDQPRIDPMKLHETIAALQKAQIELAAQVHAIAKSNGDILSRLEKPERTDGD